MSDATAAAPSNGASAPTTPAPGVASPTPAPKSGEGAVAPAPAKGAETATPAKPSWNPIRTKLKFGDGQEEEVEIPDEDTLRRRLIAAKGFDRERKKSLELERKVQDFLEQAKDADALLKAAGHDPEKYFREKAEREYRRLQMTEEQRKAEDYQSELQREKAERVKYQTELQQIRQKQAADAEWNRRQPAYIEAMQAAGEHITEDFVMNELFPVALEHEAAGIPWDPKAEVAEALERRKENKEKWLGSLQPEAFLSLGKSALSKLKPEQIRAALPKEVIREIVRIEAEEFKRSRGIQSSTPPPVSEAPKANEPEYLDERTFLRQIRGR